ncbi:MAG: hypothetical protein U1D96_03490 [Eubacteriales bacterium]|nr:hypothetical protein [Eubacteriales bacterium]
MAERDQTVIQPAAADIDPGETVSGKSIARASYILGNLPVLMRRLKAARVTVLHSGGTRSINSNRKSQGLHSDPTAKKAFHLLELRDKTRELRLVKLFVEREIVLYEDRQLLLAVWRSGRYGWRFIARTLGRKEQDVRLSWLLLATKLAANLPDRTEGGDDES